MRVLLRETIACLLIGLITTVATAWLLGIVRVGEPLFARQSGVTNHESVANGAGRGWQLQQDNYLGRRTTFLGIAHNSTLMQASHSAGWLIPGDFNVDGELVLKRLLDAIPGLADRDVKNVSLKYMYARCEFGWPFRSLWCAREGSRRTPEYGLRFQQSETAGGIVIPKPNLAWDRLWPEPVLAYRPLWAGLAADTAVYAPLWWIVLFLPFRLRRVARLYRGRCRSCGYRLDGNCSGRCPECGTPGPVWDLFASGEIRRGIKRRAIRTVAGGAALILAAGIVWRLLPPPRPVGTLSGAIRRCETKQVRAHLYWGADPNGNPKGYGHPLINVFYNECQRDCPEIVKLLLAYGADIQASDGVSGGTPVYCAAYFNDPESLRILLRHGGDVHVRDESKDRSPLLGAMTSVGGNQAEIDIANMLLDAGADINARDDEGNTPLLVKTRYGDPRILRLLLKRGADVHARRQDGYTALHIVVQRPNESSALRTELLEMLVSAGLNVKVSTRCGERPLHLAATKNHAGWINDLRQRGANPNAADFWGDTPLFYAVRHPPADVETYRLLLDSGANLHRRNKRGRNLIHVAVETWWDYSAPSEAMRYLVAQGVDVNAADAYGETPLHMAVRRGYREYNGRKKLVTLLLELGADPRRRNREGSPVTLLTERCGHTEIAELLRAALRDSR